MLFEKLLSMESSWELLLNTHLPVVVYGTGNGADRVFAELERLGITVSAVAASDDFVRRRQFHGFEVKSISQLDEELGDFTVALAFASPLPEVMNNIKRLSQCHQVVMPSVPVYGDNIFNKDFLRTRLDDIETAYSLLGDEQSRKTYENIIRFQITGDLQYCFDCENGKDEAFSLLDLTDSESYLDLGAYRGDTVDEFLSYVNGYSDITAVEPDKRAFRKLTEHCKGLERITLINSAVWSSKGEASMNGGRGRGSCVGDGGETICAVSVDEICPPHGLSYIKADVEGSEKAMLCGAHNTLRDFKPKLNIAAYHRSEDIFALVNQIHAINGDYRIFLRHHPHISFWDTNLYCI